VAVVGQPHQTLVCTRIALCTKAGRLEGTAYDAGSIGIHMCLHERLSRRGMLRALLAASTLTALPWRGTHANTLYDGPFVDAHTHLRWDAGVAIDDLVALYDAAGVQGVLLFGQPWSIATDARDRYPRRVSPFLAEGYADAVHPDSSYVHADGLELLLGGGFVRGLGEIICRHSPYQLGASGGYASAPANNVPADHPALIQAYRVAGRFGATVNVHQEWFFADELERAVRAAPDTTFVWAHAGHGPADVVRRVLQRNPNVLADLSARTPWIGPGTVLLRPDGTLAAEWSTVLHEFPDRFLVGLDLFVPDHYRPAYVNQLVGYYRGLLGQLNSDAAQLIGHANAERLAGFSSG
jgi:predicted TIM-barrel fold metal-dependent hydrolase